MRTLTKFGLLLSTVFHLTVTLSSGQVQAPDTTISAQDSIIISKLDLVFSNPKDSVQATPTNTIRRLDVLKPPDIKELISIPKIIWAIVFVVVGYLIIRVFEKLVNMLAERYPKYRLNIKSLIPIIKIFGWIFVIFLITYGIFQPPIATILAFSASIGVAVGFASQDILKNIFAGIAVLFDQPFKVGDKIESGKYYGEVVEIGLYSTRIVTPEDSLVTIPNGEMMNSSVANANSGEHNCQVVAEIFLAVNIDTTEIRELAIEAVKISRFVYLSKPIVVLFSHEVREKQAYLKMKVKAYVLDIRDEFKFKSDIVELIMRVLVEKGIVE